MIPTFNEEECIGNCLKAIKSGSVTPDEIIIADGYSSDKTVEIASKYGAKIVVNHKRHAAGGRNAGIKASCGDVIVFIDADCIPAHNWLEEIVKAFENENIDGLGTYIEPAETSNRYEKFWGTLSLQIMMSYDNEAYYVTDKSLNTAFITASCAYKKDLLYRIKGFSNFFANNAEDIDICWRALDAGAKLKYLPTAKIIAHSPRNLKGICRKSFRNGISSSKLQKVFSKKRISIDKNLYKALLNNIAGVFKGEEFADLFIIEIICHLGGKYYGSLKNGVINL